MLTEQRSIIDGILRGAELCIKVQTGINVTLIIAFDKEELSISPEEMMGVIAQSLKCTIDDYYNLSRDRKYIDLRCIAAVFTKKYFPHISFKQTAVMFGLKDHSTIWNYGKRAEAYLYTNEETFMEKYNRVLKEITKWIKE
jgi:chromosomal replication initiation ATPase DnaA